jgi:hypothetical protein
MQSPSKFQLNSSTK